MPIVRIDISEGRAPQAAKEKITAELTESIVRNTGVAPEKVLVFWNDIPRYLQAVGGKMREQPPAPAS